MMDIERYRAEAEREAREYDEAKRALKPHQRQRWAEIEESYEWFDGESAIAHGTLVAALRRGELDR